MKSSLIIILISLSLMSCTQPGPELLIGTWSVTSFEHSSKAFNSAERAELESRAKSTTYTFKNDFTIEVTSNFSGITKEGDWFWDPYGQKIVIDENNILSASVDTINVHEMRQSEMTWIQHFPGGETTLIHLKKKNE